MRSSTLTKVLVLILSMLHAVWANYYRSHQEENHYYGAHHHSHNRPKHRFTRNEPVTSVPLDDIFEEFFTENHAQLLPDRLLTLEELIEGGSGDRFPSDMQFIDDMDVINLHHSTIGSTEDSKPTTESPSSAKDAHMWPIHDEHAQLVTAEEIGDFFDAAEEIVNPNPRDSVKATNKRQILLGKDFKPLFLLPSQLQQRLAFVIPGQPGQMSFLLSVDRSFVELLSRSVIVPGQGILLQTQRQELHRTETEQPVNASPSQEASTENPVQDQEFFGVRPKMVVMNAIPVDAQAHFTDSSVEELLADQNANKKGMLSESQPFEEIHFVPLESNRLTTPSPTRSPLHDQLLHAKVVVAPSKARNGKNRPIVTAIPSVVASAPRQEQADRAVQDASTSPWEVANDLTTEDSSGAFESNFLEQERSIRQLLEDEQELLDSFMRHVDSNEMPDFETLTELPIEEEPEMGRNFDHVHERRSVLNVAEPRHQRLPARRPPANKRQTNQFTKIELLPVRLVRQDAPMESQIAAEHDDGHREIRMPRPKSPNTWPKPGQAAATFSGAQGKPFIRPSDQPSSRVSRPSRPKQSTLMMALLPRHLLHPVPSAAPPQQVPPARPQPVVHAQQAQSDQVVAAAQGPAQQERTKRSVPRQSQRPEAHPAVPKTIPRPQENGENRRTRDGQGTKENAGVQNSQSTLPQQSRAAKVTETPQGSQDNRGPRTPVMQSTASFMASSINQIPTLAIYNRPTPPNRVPTAGFRRFLPNSASPSGSITPKASSLPQSKISVSLN